MLYNLHSKPHTLDHHEKLDTHHPRTVWEIYTDSITQLKKRAAIFAKDPDTAVSYAIRTGKPFPLGEESIAKSPDASYSYAGNVLKKPFPLGEPAIAKNAERACLYALNILKKPFPLGEPAIAKNAEYARVYAIYVLKKPFPLGEPAIAKGEYSSGAYIKAFPQRRQAILELQKKP